MGEGINSNLKTKMSKLKLKNQNTKLNDNKFLLISRLERSDRSKFHEYLKFASPRQARDREIYENSLPD